MDPPFSHSKFTIGLEIETLVAGAQKETVLENIAQTLSELYRQGVLDHDAMVWKPLIGAVPDRKKFLVMSDDSIDVHRGSSLERDEELTEEELATIRTLADRDVRGLVDVGHDRSLMQDEGGLMKLKAYDKIKAEDRRNWDSIGVHSSGEACNKLRDKEAKEVAVTLEEPDECDPPHTLGSDNIGEAIELLRDTQVSNAAKDLADNVTSEPKNDTSAESVNWATDMKYIANAASESENTGVDSEASQDFSPHGTSSSWTDCSEAWDEGEEQRKHPLDIDASAVTLQFLGEFSGFPAAFDPPEWFEEDQDDEWLVEDTTQDSGSFEWVGVPNSEAMVDLDKEPEEVAGVLNLWEMEALGAGAEICTPIMSSANYGNIIRTFLAHLEDRYSLIFNKSTGLHIHIGCGAGKKWSLENLKRISKALVLFDRQMDQIHASYRQMEVMWMIQPLRSPKRPFGDTIPQAIDLIEACRSMHSFLAMVGDEKFKKYNLGANARYGTVEFRQMEARGDGERAIAWVKFIMDFLVAALNTEHSEYREIARMTAIDAATLHKFGFLGKNWKFLRETSLRGKLTNA